MTTMTEPTRATTQVNSVYIRATPQAIDGRGSGVPDPAAG